MATNARNFASASDAVVTLSLGSVGVFGTGSGSTIAAVIKIADLTAVKSIFSAGVGDPNGWGFFVDTNETLGFWNGSAAVNSSLTLSGTSDWYLVAMTKATGSVAVRWHAYNYTTDTWTHEAGSTLGNSATPGTACRIGADLVATVNDMNGTIQVVGYWASVLSDANMETLPPTYAAWAALSPAALWPLTQAATATNVEDIVGGADQTALTATTVVAGNSEWAAAPYARHFTRPDSEVQTDLGSVGAWGAGGSTVVAMVKTTDVTNTKVIFAPGGTAAWTYQVDADESIAVFSDGGGGVKRNSAVSRIVSGHWHIVAATKATGTATPRFHIYDYSTLTWVHENGGGTQADSNVPGGPATIYHGQDNASAGAGWEGEIQVTAFWAGTELSDGDIETLVPGKYAWLALSPSAIWPFTQASTGTAVQDEIGTADQTFTSGTSVTTGNPNWDESDTPPAPDWPPSGSENSDRTLIVAGGPRLR